MEFIWFACLVFVCYLILRFGIRLWIKEAHLREGARALSRRMQADARALADETEAWVKGFFNHKEDK